MQGHCYWKTCCNHFFCSATVTYTLRGLEIRFVKGPLLEDLKFMDVATEVRTFELAVRELEAIDWEFVTYFV